MKKTYEVRLILIVDRRSDKQTKGPKIFIWYDVLECNKVFGECLDNISQKRGTYFPASLKLIIIKNQVVLKDGFSQYWSN